MLKENQDTFQQFFREANFGKSPELTKLDTAILKKFEAFVKKPIKDVTKNDVVDYFNSLTTTMAPYSIELHKSQIKKFFKWFYNFAETEKVPVQVSWFKVNRKKVYKYKTQADILTTTEVQLLIDFAQKTLSLKTVLILLFLRICFLKK